jgi:hypothetical protein
MDITKKYPKGQEFLKVYTYFKEQAQKSINKYNYCNLCLHYNCLTYDNYATIIHCTECYNDIEIRKYLKDFVILIKDNFKFSINYYSEDKLLISNLLDKSDQFEFNFNSIDNRLDKLVICNLKDKSDQFEFDYDFNDRLEYSDIIINYPYIYINVYHDVYLINMKNKTYINIKKYINDYIYKINISSYYFISFCQFIGKDKVKLKLNCYTKVFRNSTEIITVIFNTNTLKIIKLISDI